jgi:predicted nucleotidyltransferase
MATIELRPEWLAIIRGLISAFLPDAEVLAYGSRVTGTCHEASDLDLVARNPVDADKPMPGVAGLREAFSESNLPILVDILDWARIPESFRQEIIRGGVVLIHGRNEEEFVCVPAVK